ncbi:MAG: membrane lipoprotein lipid attachment site-containing protein [Candidatus Peribacteria bacterium]|jgi:hypothetical protein|nr:membrane lipoprotein lipid attachment site-containing protein [Candidatus Peribacteria bacterium]
MKKLITLLSLLFILTSCWGKKDNTDVNVDTNSGTQIEENIPANTTVDIEEIQIETDSTIYDNLSGSELQEVTSS